MAADQLEMFSIPNPCIGICESNQRGYCKGCLRSREERFNWHSKPPTEQSEILQRLSKRRTRLLQQRKNTQHENDSPNLQLPGFTDE